MLTEQNKSLKNQSSMLTIYGLAQVVGFCLMLTIIGFSVNQIFKSLHQVKESDFFILKHLKIMIVP